MSPIKFVQFSDVKAKATELYNHDVVASYNLAGRFLDILNCQIEAALEDRMSSVNSTFDVVKGYNIHLVCDSMREAFDASGWPEKAVRIVPVDDIDPVIQVRLDWLA